jgi:hypothetical protein
MIGRKVGGHDIIFLECSHEEAGALAAGLRLLQRDSLREPADCGIRSPIKLAALEETCQALAEVPLRKAATA